MAFGDFFEDLIDAFSDLFEGKELLDEFADFFGEFGIGHRFGFEEFLLNGVFVFGFFFFRCFEQVDELLFFLAH